MTFRKRYASIAMMAISFMAFSQPAHAQGFIPEPGTPSQTQFPEPPGNGPWSQSASEVGGDPLSTYAPVKSGKSDKSTGVHQAGFGVAIGRDSSIAHLHRTQNLQRDNAQRAQTTGSMMTIRPDQLSAKQLASIQGILGVDLMTGLQTVDVFPTDSQLGQIQQVLSPYPTPNAMNAYSWDKKTSPANGPGWTVLPIKRTVLNMKATPDPTYYPKPLEQNIYDFQGPLPTVRKLSRLFVLIGVVAATIFMAFAAYSVVLGHREGASRVVGTAAGLLLLLSAYTIWKIVNVNAFAFRGMPNPRLETDLFNRPQVDPVEDSQMPTLNLPINPAGLNQPRPARSGVPVIPLSGR